jgi:hypothetical protein
VYAWGYEKLSGDKGFAFSLCECGERRFECFADGALNGIKAFCPKHPNVVSRNLGGRKNDYRLSDKSRHGPIIDLSVLGRALCWSGFGSGFRARCRCTAFPGAIPTAAAAVGADRTGLPGMARHMAAGAI